MKEHEWESDGVSRETQTYKKFILPHILLVKIWVVVGSCGGANSGTAALSSSFPLNSCEWMFHETSGASILLELDLTVCPADYYYYLKQ